MIPVKLVVEGLYSYQKRQEIDFTKLTDSHIFGIFGSVGSGKSSILEAITFALYGKTDRLNLSGDNRNYNMMNLRSKSLYVEFVFRAGEEEYMVTVKGRRNSKKYDDVKAFERSAYFKDENGEWIPIELNRIEEKIGLSYDNFKRTIIIPQGKFKEFLELGNKDRTQMMKEIFNLGKFELFYKITALESKNNKNIENLKGGLTQLSEVDEEALKVAENTLKDTGVLLNKLVKGREEGALKEKEYQEIKDASAKLQKAEMQLQELKAKSTEYAQLEKEVRYYEYCLIHFKALLESMEKCKVEKGSLEDKLKRADKIYEISKGKIQDIRKANVALKADYDKRDIHRQKADELGKIKEILRTTEKNKEINIRIEKGDKYCKITEEKVNKIKENILLTEKKIAYKKSKMPDLRDLSVAREWFINDKFHKEKLNEFLKERMEIEAILKESNQTVFEMLNNEILKDAVKYSDEDKFSENSTYLIDIKDSLPEAFGFNKLISEKEEKINEIDNKIADLRVKEKFEIYATELKEGEPCPICGSLHHPNIASKGEIGTKIADLKKQKDEITAEKEMIKNIIDALTKIADSTVELANKLKIVCGDIEREEKCIKEHNELFKWEKFTSIDEIDKVFDEYSRLKALLEEHEKEYKVLNEEHEREKNNLEKYRKEVDRIKSELVANNAGLKLLKEQVKLYNADDYADVSLSEIDSLIYAETHRYNDIEAKYNEGVEEYNKLVKAIAELETKKSMLLDSFAKEKENYKEILNKLNKQLESSEFDNLDDIKDVLSKNLDTEGYKKDIAAYKEQTQLLEHTVKDYKGILKDRKYNEEEHNKLKAELERFDKEITHKNQELGRQNALVTKFKDELEKKKLLQKKLNELELRGEDIRVLKKMFKGSGFVNYVSSVHLKNLCIAANDRFYRLTRQKLRLEMGDDNSFMVRDFMNGGNIRSIKTLSGGQTFQASLSLALALSDSVKKYTNFSQNFFFLDEGFGSLDRESLSIVFEALKSLRKEDRIIGVISHVEEMQQEIEVYVKVENRADEGSIISASWQ